MSSKGYDNEMNERFPLTVQRFRENAEHHTAFMASLHRANATVLQLSASRERRASLQREIEAVQTALLDQTIACGFFLSLHSLVERFDNALDLTRAEVSPDPGSILLDVPARVVLRRCLPSRRLLTTTLYFRIFAHLVWTRSGTFSRKLWPGLLASDPK